MNRFACFTAKRGFNQPSVFFARRIEACIKKTVYIYIFIHCKYANIQKYALTPANKDIFTTNKGCQQQKLDDVGIPWYSWAIKHVWQMIHLLKFCFIDTFDFRSWRTLRFVANRWPGLPLAIWRCLDLQTQHAGEVVGSWYLARFIDTPYSVNQL